MVDVDASGADFTGAYRIRRHIMDENYLHEFRNHSRFNEALYWLWWCTSDCGRSVTRWGLCTLALILAFAAAYAFVDIDYGANRTPLSSVYFSVVTMTTLGYGDVLPTSMAAQALIVVQVLLGYTMLGGLLSLFATAMARRAD